MDPFTMALAAAFAAVAKSTRDERERAKRVLVQWDGTLRAFKGKAGQRIPIPLEVRRALRTLRDDRCAHGSLFNRCSGPLAVDHVVPLANGGYNYADNLQLVCTLHNSRKGARMDLDHERRRR